MAEYTPTYHVELLSSVLVDLRSYPGLGCGIVNHATLAGVERAVVRQGAPVSYFEAEPLRWLRDTRALKTSLADRMRAGGFDLTERLQPTYADLKAVQRFSPVVLVDQSKTRQLLRNPRYIRDPDEVFGDFKYDRLLDIGEEWAEIRHSILKVGTEHDRLILDCLKTGRVLSVDTSRYQASFVPPTDWKGGLGRNALKQCMFLLSCELPAALQSKRQGGAVPDTEISAENEAIRLLESAYVFTAFDDRFLKKKDAQHVLCDILDISAAAMTERVWLTAEIANWKTRGRRPSALLISREAFRDFVRKNKTTGVGD